MLLLQTVENSHKQSDHLRNLGKQNRETGRKRERSVTDKGSKARKRARMDVNVTSNEDSEFLSDLQDEFRQDESHNAYQTNRCIPHQLIGLMYQLDLTILCLLRESLFKHKYPSLSLAFGDSEIDRFSNIVLRYEKKSVHIQIENVDKYYADNDINYTRLFTKGKHYARLFTKGKQSFSINNYFNSFVKHRISKSDSLSNNIEYLVIYTNVGLSLTEEKKLKKGQSRYFYPLEFDSMNIKECDILKDFLFTNNNTQGHGFYQFSQNKTTREELLKQLEFLPAMQKGIKERNFSQEEIKEAFLDKLVFAVNQPNREELNSIVKNEIKKNSKTQDGYIALQEKILCDLAAPEKYKKFKRTVNYVPGILYEFNLLLSFLHDMFLHKRIISINFEGKSHDTSNSIVLHYKNKITYVKTHNTNSNIGYSQLFTTKMEEKRNVFSINEYFTHFIEELGKDKDIKYFVIYTNSDLDLTEEKKFKKNKSKDFYPLKFENIDIRRKKYKILRRCFSCINENGLYQFSQEETTKLLSLLKLPSSLQKEKEKGKLSSEKEQEIKEKLLNKLIFAVNQPNKEKLSVIMDEIEKNNKSNEVAYNYEELHEIALRWLESHEFGSITKGVMGKLFEDIKNNRSSYQKIQNKDIEKTKFAKSVIGREGTPAFDQFSDFLIKGEGKNYLEFLKRKGIKLASMSSILSGTKGNAEKAFKDLYDIWFDVKGNKTQYLKTLEKEGISLSNMSSILHATRANSSKVFKDLYNLWFDEAGNKTQYFKTLEKEGIRLANVFSFLRGAKAKAPKAFKDLYDLWFDSQGNKTQYLTALEKEGINLANVSSILDGSRADVAKAFKDLYDLWFDPQGNGTLYLTTLKKERVSLTNMSSILSGSGVKAAEAFKDLYDFWFDEQGNKTQYLKTLEKEEVKLPNMSNILHSARINAAKAFEDLYDLWFDTKGNKTPYLKILENEGINLVNVSSILGGAGANAANAFKDLYDLWFDAQGNKTLYLKTLEREEINLSNVSSILGGAGTNAAKAFKNLYDLWFDAQGNKTQYLTTLEKEGVILTNASSILHGAGVSAAKAFKDLYDLWFDAQGNKTLYLKTLEMEEVNLSNVSGVLSGAGTNAAKAFRDLYDVWFSEQGNKTQYLKTLEKEGVNLPNISSILAKAGSNAAKAFKELYDLWFDEEGNRTQLKTLEKEGIELVNMSSILNGAGANAPKAFNDLYGLWFDVQGNKKEHLKHFTEKRNKERNFTISNLSGILGGSGAKASNAFKKLHDVCFNDDGEETELLNNFYDVGFEPGNLSSMLCGSGSRASHRLKNFHNTLFDDKGRVTGLLSDFHKIGFDPQSLCNILSASVSSLEQFHDFCSTKEVKAYLNHFSQGGFTIKNLSNILHGARASICSALKDFHNVCFDEQGNNTQLLYDFHNVGFTAHHLSTILGMAGNNSASILKNFHKSCFNKRNYLSHFLTESKLFTPKGISYLLCRIGISVRSTFKKLHDLCFDKAGNRKSYLDDLIKNKQEKVNKMHRKEILNILYNEVRKPYFTA